MAENTNLRLQSYYNDLTKKDKTKLIGFLMWKCGMSYDSAFNHLSGRSSFNEIELQVVGPLVLNDAWKQ